MGRTLKRVPLDFAWPLKKTWEGYLNPEGGPCPEEGKTCFGGYTAAGKWLESVSRLISMLGEEASEGMSPRRSNRIYPHPYLEEFAQAPRTEMPREVIAKIREIPDSQERVRAHMDYARKHPAQLLPMTPELLAFCEALAGCKIYPMCGSQVAWAIAQTLKNAAKVDDKWGECPVCEGHADDPAKRAAAEAWEKTEPPAGDGFQLWETTSEGSPVSPVFGTIEALCNWCADNATTFGSCKTSAEEWRKMLDADFVHHAVGNMVFL